MRQIKMFKTKAKIKQINKQKILVKSHNLIDKGDKIQMILFHYFIMTKIINKKKINKKQMKVLSRIMIKPVLNCHKIKTQKKVNNKYKINTFIIKIKKIKRIKKK